MSHQYIVCGHCKTYHKEEIPIESNPWDTNEFLAMIGADVDFRCDCGGFPAVVTESDFNVLDYKGYTSR